MQKISACLITWKRQQNIPKIVEKLERYPFISEILIRDNSKCDNIMNLGRYVLAHQASNEIVYFQDDDWLVDPTPLYEEFVKNPDTLVHTGVEDYEKKINEHTYGDKQMAMVGFGAILNRNWAVVLNKYIEKYGKDYCFFRETDRIFTILLEKHHKFVPTTLESLNDRDEHALSAQPDHLEYKMMAIERALAL